MVEVKIVGDEVGNVVVVAAVGLKVMLLFVRLELLLCLQLVLLALWFSTIFNFFQILHAQKEMER